MAGKRKGMEVLEEKTRLIGIAGIGHSVGCTHFSIMLLNYLAGFKRRKAALLEWNPSGDFEKLEKACTGKVQEKKPYRVLDADYFKNAGPEEMAYVLHRDYEDILVDFGVLTRENKAELLRCEKQFLVGSFSEWQQEKFREYAMENGGAGKNSWQYLAAFGSEETRKEFKRRYGIFTERIPFSADAFSVTEECGIFFRKLV